MKLCNHETRAMLASIQTFYTAATTATKHPKKCSYLLMNIHWKSVAYDEQTEYNFSFETLIL